MEDLRNNRANIETGIPLITMSHRPALSVATIVSNMAGQVSMEDTVSEIS